MNGVLVIDKPAGPTSFDVVQRVRRLAAAGKAGHAGTLDPAATGVLAVCLGEAVKLQHWLADADKAYEATIAFGAATDTEDAQGRVVETGDASGLDEGAVRAALRRFEGEIEQVPPMYSAVRVGGRRLHVAARAGEEVERAPRRVRIHALSLLSFSSTPEHVEARVLLRCGKGTYVRTLASDLGRALGVPAHLAALRRTEASGFRVEDALTLEEAERLAAEGPNTLRRRVIPLGEALRFLPAVHLDAAAAVSLAHGRPLHVTPVGVPATPTGERTERTAPEGMPGTVPEESPPETLVRALGPGDMLVAVCAARTSGLWPVRVFVTPGQAAGGANPGPKR